MSFNDHMELPGVLAEIAEATDLDTAIKIADAYGGTDCYFPSTLNEDCWLVRLVGFKKAKAITEALSTTGMEILVPMGPATTSHKKRMQVHQLVDKGTSNRKIALATKYHVRHIYRIKKKDGLNKDPNQLDLL